MSRYRAAGHYHLQRNPACKETLPREVMAAELTQDRRQREYVVGADFVEFVFAVIGDPLNRLKIPLNSAQSLGLTPLTPLSIRPPS